MSQKTYEEDYGLNYEALDDKYNPDGDGEHPGYPIVEWRNAVFRGETLRSYWQWVEAQLFQEACDSE